MKGRKLLLGAGILTLSVFLGSGLKAQASEQVVEDKVIQVKLRRPPQPSKYYSGTSIKKNKKVKYKTRMLKGYECPSYLWYTSKPKAKREKAINKRRRELQAKK